VTLWRHKRRGTVYAVLAENILLQCATDEEVEQRFANQSWVVYRSIDTGNTYVRLTAEFHDGRFEKVERREES